MKLLLTLAILFTSHGALAWGGRGHHTICSVASFLVKEQGLKEYLQHKPQMMGHLCNMPDFHWKSLGSEAVQLGNPTHFIDIEVIGLDVKDIPSDYKQIIKKYTGTEDKFKNDGTTIKSIPQEFGSSWWRVDQFMRRMAAQKNEFRKAKLPSNYQEEQDSNFPYNKLAYDFVISLGIMGHYVGDNAQPFHTSADYDGYGKGHGGIHAYYEDSVVGLFDGDLEYLVLTNAREMKNPTFLKPKTAIEKMKALSAISNGEMKNVLAVDPVKKPSVLKIEKGMQLKTAAEREPASVAFPKMKPMIVEQMARGALLLANLWDEAYVSAGRPKLGAYKSYKYPFTVDFIAPDYFEIPKK